MLEGNGVNVQLFPVQFAGAQEAMRPVKIMLLKKEYSTFTSKILRGKERSFVRLTLKIPDGVKMEVNG